MHILFQMHKISTIDFFSPSTVGMDRRAGCIEIKLTKKPFFGALLRDEDGSKNIWK